MDKIIANFIENISSKTFIFLFVFSVILFLLSSFAHKGLGNMLGIEPMIISAIPLIFILILITVTAFCAVINNPLAKKTSLLVGIFFIVSTIISIFQNNFTPSFLILGGLYFSYSLGKEQSNKILSGKEFSKESLRNYLLLILILCIPILLVLLERAFLKH